MATWPGFTVTEPVATTLAGAQGVRVDVTATGDLGSCVTPTTWSTDIGTWIDAYPMADADAAARQPATFRILDVGGELLVVRTQATLTTSPHEASQGVAPDPDRHAKDIRSSRMRSSPRSRSVTRPLRSAPLPGTCAGTYQASSGGVRWVTQERGLREGPDRVQRQLQGRAAAIRDQVHVVALVPSPSTGRPRRMAPNRASRPASPAERLAVQRTPRRGRRAKRGRARATTARRRPPPPRAPRR